jgi:hypothetical protein
MQELCGTDAPHRIVIYAAAAARNARAPRGQKNAPRIFALLFFRKFFAMMIL